MCEYYRLDNGKIWNVAEARYVDNLPAGAVCARPLGEDGKTANEDGLRFCLRSFGCPLGEAATDEDLAEDARAKRKYLQNPKHLIIESDHPSPLSAWRGFFGSRPFSKINAYLTAHGLPEIDWRT